MAFDWSKLEGYREDMTADEKLALLDKVENPFPRPEGVITKAQFDKVSSELAAVKKQLQAKQTDDEKKEAERLAAEENMKNELETLRTEKTIAAYKASYLSQGYDEKSATDAATAMTKGEMTTVFSIMKQQSENAEKALRAKILKETPTPPAGDTPPDDGSKGASFAKQLADFTSKSNTASQNAINHYLGGAKE